MDIPDVRPLKAPKFWNRPTTKHYGLRTYDVHRVFGNSYREYKNNKTYAQAQSFVDPIKTADMPSSWCGQYEEPKFLTDTYVSMRRPKHKTDIIKPAPRTEFANLTAAASTSNITTSSRSSFLSTKYGSQYIGGVRSTSLGGSSDSYARLEARFEKLWNNNNNNNNNNIVNEI